MVMVDPMENIKLIILDHFIYSLYVWLFLFLIDKKLDKVHFGYDAQ